MIQSLRRDHVIRRGCQKGIHSHTGTTKCNQPYYFTCCSEPCALFRTSLAFCSIWPVSMVSRKIYRYANERKATFKIQEDVLTNLVDLWTCGGDPVVTCYPSVEKGKEIWQCRNTIIFDWTWNNRGSTDMPRCIAMQKGLASH